MKKFNIIFLFVLIILNSCITTCEDIKKYYSSVNYEFTVFSKSRSRDFIFEGYDKKGNLNQFILGPFWNFYDYVEKGDSIVKLSGHTEIKLIKKDTILIFPLMCKGKIVE